MTASPYGGRSTFAPTHLKAKRAVSKEPTPPLGAKREPAVPVTPRVRGALPPTSAALEIPADASAAILGDSPAMRQVVSNLPIFAASDSTVLIDGESGTGKELVARALHAASPRRKGPFVAINCAAIPETLLEAELFGYERGAFTGATGKRVGRFLAANSGTLFLDEIGEMPLSAQAKLLRVLDEGRVAPLGTNSTQPVNVRLISATNQNLSQTIERQLFRKDLFYRIKVLHLRLPPLRERGDDTLLLAREFARRYVRRGDSIQFSAESRAALRAYSYPGNVRELAHAIEAAMVIAQGEPILLEHLPWEIRHPTPKPPSIPSQPIESLAAAKGNFERQYIIEALRQSRGCRGATAARLSISRKSLWEKMCRHKILEKEYLLPPQNLDLPL